MGRQQLRFLQKRTSFLFCLILVGAFGKSFSLPAQEGSKSYWKDNTVGDGEGDLESRISHDGYFSRRLSSDAESFPSGHRPVGRNSRIAKRSTDGFESFMLTHGYDPFQPWAKRNFDDDQGKYYQSISYVPFVQMEKIKKQLLPDANEDTDGSFRESPESHDISYYPDSSYDDAVRFEYGDVFFPQHFFGMGKKSDDEFMETVYHPYNFFHGFKRSFPPYNLVQNYLANRHFPTGGIEKVFRKGIFVPNFAATPSMRQKRGTDQVKRRPEMTSSGFYGDTFSGGFGDFDTMKKRKLGTDASGFYGDTFSDGFGSFSTMKKRLPEWDSSGFHGDTFSGGFGDFSTMRKRRPDMDSMGFYGNTFSHGFGDFETMKRHSSRNKRDIKLEKRRPEMTSSGFYGDTFSNGFGDFDTMKKRPEMTSSGFYGDTFSGGFGDFDTMKRGSHKRRPEMTSSGFYGDTFSGGFGDFDTMKRGSKKRRPEMTSSGFYGDTFSGGFGDFDTMKRGNIKRRPEMTSSGFYGDTFSGGFGDFDTMKRGNNKRRPEMTSSGFYGDTFSGGFGDFDTMKRGNIKRRPEMTSSGFYGDTFSGGFGDFDTMKRGNNKRRPEMTSSGFYGDTFSGGFGDFDTMKRGNIKRRPEMTSSGFYGDTFSNGFGDFDTMRKRLFEVENSQKLMQAESTQSPPNSSNDTEDKTDSTLHGKLAQKNKLNKDKTR